MMKNLFKKLALFALASVILSNFVIPSFVANAGACNPNPLLEILEGEECINLDEKTSPNDKDKIITIVEEPLSVNPADFGTTGEDGASEFEVRPCLRISTVCKDENIGIITDSFIMSGTTYDPCEEGVTSGTETGTTYYYCKEVMVLLSTGGPTMIMGFISMIYKWGASIVGLIAVLVIVISGIQISASGGDSSAIDGAKGRILKSIGGLAVLFLSGVILYTINPNFFTK